MTKTNSQRVTNKNEPPKPAGKSTLCKAFNKGMLPVNDYE